MFEITEYLQLLVIPSYIYLAYFISKNYQIKRIINISQAINLNPESTSLVHNMINILPAIFSIKSIDMSSLHFNLSLISSSLISTMTIVLGMLIWISHGVYRIQYISLIRMITFLQGAHFILFFVTAFNEIYTEIAIFALILIGFE